MITIIFFSISIWNHLVTLTRKERITVIVTTHYIEEARQANVVGLMRQGRLLAENSPDQLMIDHNLDTLEDVFLKLCMSDISFKAAALSNYTAIPRSDLNLTAAIVNEQPQAAAVNHTISIDNETTVSPNITAKQFNQIETNGDLKNIIKVSLNPNL
ncbi:hypothetical protein BLA29_009003 [Euroglyphus maynei]|uniref:ABC transporter domain-containing protein n=1 Tax=Euroglyphus maynei TaxID=6958 RepID=A0A1Y3B9R7_EURMA|nr:hypothetical protein BLA29_009003 [Euroglyphus maynei]